MLSIIIVIELQTCSSICFRFDYTTLLLPQLHAIVCLKLTNSSFAITVGTKHVTFMRVVVHITFQSNDKERCN